MSQPSGWYDDPHDPTHLRYFDGVIWTENRAPKASPTAAQSTIGHAQPPTREMPAGQAPGQPPQYNPQQYGQQPGQPPQYGQQPGQPPQYGQQPGQPPQYGQQPPYGQPPQGWQHGGLALGAKTTPDGEPLSGWGLRLWARIIDGVILGVVTGIVGAKYVSGYVGWFTDYMDQVIKDAGRGVQTPMDMTTMQGEILQYIVPLVLIGAAVSLAYETFFLVRSGATPGKMAAGIRVRRRGTPGNLTVVDALKRQAITFGCNVLGLVPLISLITSLLPLLDGLWPLWDDKRQALHDKVADTNVVLKRQR